MSRSVGVLLATPPGFNAGMLATELALDAFMDRHGSDRVVTRYRLLSLDERVAVSPEERAAIVARGYRDDARSAIAAYGDFVKSDVLLYWADYSHMAQYHAAMRKIVAARIADGRTEEEIATLVNDVLLLASEGDAVLARTISVGTSLLFNTPADERTSDYGNALRRFALRSRRIWVRDALSAARVAQLRGIYARSHFGVDCALLLRRADFESHPTPEGSDRPVLTFFGRDTSVREPMEALAQSLAASMHRPLLRLPWGDRAAFPNLVPSDTPLAVSATAGIRELVTTVARAALVVTDTYHLAVVAWSLGVPAIATFGFALEPGPDVSAGAQFNRRDKREIFFSQYDALDFLVRPEELTDRAALERRREHLTSALQDGERVQAVVANVRTHAERIEAELARELDELLK